MNYSWSVASRIAQSSVLVGTIGLLLILAGFESVSRLEILPSQWFPPVTIIFGTLADLLIEAGFWDDVWLTLRGWGVGLGIAALIAIPFGLLVGTFDVAYRSFRIVIEFLRPIPSVALVPAAVLVFGIGMEMKLFLVAFAAFWPILFQAVYGVRDVDPGLKETARAYGLKPAARFVHIVIPSTAVYIATGIRISSAIALILAVTAELVVGAPGLGRSIMVSRSAAQIPGMYALIVATGIIGWGLNGAFQMTESRLLHWHPSKRAASR